MSSIKTIPLADLILVSFTYQCDVFETEGGSLIPVMDHEVYDDAAWDLFQATSSFPRRTRCDCCGHSLKYSCLIQHVPSKAFYFVGRDCARTFTALKDHASVKNDDVGMAVAQRLACNRREAQWLAANTDGAALLAWAKTGLNRTAQDIAGKLRSYGLSDAQTAFLRSLKSKDDAQRAAATGKVEAGKQNITGTIASVKAKTIEPYTRWDKTKVVYKVLVALDNGTKVWGSAPGSFDETGTHAITGDGTIPKQGERVSFSATVEPSDNDPLFGFFKRPTKWKIAA